MMTKKDIARNIIYWYKVAKQSAKEGCEKASLIEIGTGLAYLAIAYRECMIKEEEYNLLRNAYDRLW